MTKKNFREIDPLWKSADTLTIYQAAALIAGEEPESVIFKDDRASYFEDPENGYTDSNGISRVNAALKILINAVNSSKLKAVIRRRAWERGWDEEPSDSEAYTKQFDCVDANHETVRVLRTRGIIYRVSPDWALTTVERDVLVEWLNQKGVESGFQFDGEKSITPYLNSDHPRYSVKLAAAIKVWEGMEDETLLVGKSPKTAMTDWLEPRFEELGLVYNGIFSKNAIDNVVAVANWQTSGGAPPTPVK